MDLTLGLAVCCPASGLAKLFKSIDADSSGTITVEELKKALQDWGHRIHDVSGSILPHILSDTMVVVQQTTVSLWSGL